MSDTEVLELLESVCEATRRVERLLPFLTDAMCAAIADKPINGRYLNDGSNGGPVIAVISSRSVLSGVWSAEYHLPKEQARQVGRYLDGFTTLDAMCKAVRRMVEEESITVVCRVGGCTSSYQVRLTPDTLDAIRQSTIGKFALSC